MSAFTLESRNALRAKQIARFGMDCTIPESTRDSIVALVETAWHIMAEDYDGASLHLSVVPRHDVSSRKRINVETELSRVYGNAPHTCAATFTLYRLSFLKM